MTKGKKGDDNPLFACWKSRQRKLLGRERHLNLRAKEPARDQGWGGKHKGLAQGLRKLKKGKSIRLVHNCW